MANYQRFVNRSPAPAYSPFQESLRMSHIVTIQTQVRDPAAIDLACTRLKLPPAEFGTMASPGSGARCPSVCQPRIFRMFFIATSSCDRRGRR